MTAAVREPQGRHQSNVAAASGWIGSALEASIAASSARETYRVHLNDLGEPGAPEVDKTEYDQLRR
jgi:hypothetical protein